MVIFLLCVIVVCLLCIPVVRRGVGKLCGILLALVLVIGVIGVIGSALSPAKHQEIYTTDKQPAPKFDPSWQPFTDGDFHDAALVAFAVPGCAKLKEDYKPMYRYIMYYHGEEVFRWYQHLHNRGLRNGVCYTLRLRGFENMLDYAEGVFD
jgi:hypothetical protein